MQVVLAWAKKRGLKRIKGHEAGSINVKKVIKTCIKNDIKYLTLYAFSTENWKRPKVEINALFQLLIKFIKAEAEEFHKNNIRLLISGDVSKFNKNLQKEINGLIDLTKNKWILMAGAIAVILVTSKLD